jgi:HEAT repeat protein
MAAERRETVLDKMIELTDENIELDFGAVYKAALGDDHADVRAKAARGLWDYDDRTIIGPLIDLLRDDPSATVRAAVAGPLGVFADMAQDGKLLERDADRIRDALMAAVSRDDEDVEVRRRAIEAVATFDFPEADVAIRSAHQGPDVKLRQSSLYAMGESSNLQWLPTVVSDTDHDQPEIRFEAANALGKLGDEDTTPYLIKLVQDEDLQVQIAAIRGLGEIGGHLARTALERCLKIGDEAIEQAAEDALQAIEFDGDPLALGF